MTASYRCSMTLRSLSTPTSSRPGKWCQGGAGPVKQLPNLRKGGTGPTKSSFYRTSTLTTADQEW
jgi:hypothetical protein